MPVGSEVRRAGLVLGLGLLCYLASTGAVLAYGSPGAGLSAAGAVLALIGGFVMAVVGFIWYPIKRILRRFTRRDDNDV